MAGKKTASKQPTAPSKRAADRSPNSPPREGDIYAVQLDQGGYAFAHVLLIHKGVPKHGPFIRVFQAVKPEPTWEEAIAASGERFCIFFPMSAAQRANLAVRVASIDVPEVDRQWPIFKDFLDKPKSEERIWFRTRVDSPLNDKLGNKIPRDLLDAPFPHVVNLTALSRLIKTNWSHRTDVRAGDLAD